MRPLLALALVSTFATAPALAGEADDAEPDVTLVERGLAGAAAGLAAGAGVLLALPLSVPMIYVAALVGMPAVVGALPLLVVVPLSAALASWFVSGAFSGGLGQIVIAGLAGTAAGLATLVVGALVVPETPSTLLDLHVGVLSVLAVPSLAAAGAAALSAPFFASRSEAEEIE